MWKFGQGPEEPLPAAAPDSGQSTVDVELRRRINELLASALVAMEQGSKGEALEVLDSLLLLDEHTAKLDPNTAGIVLKLTEDIVTGEKMTTIMITHNMDHALRYGNRLIMMHKGRTVVDLNHQQRRNTSVADLLAAFERASGEQLTDDSILLSTSENPDPPES